MPIQPGVWGIDLGQCALKAIRLQEIDGELVATAFDYVEHPKILSQPDADPDQLTREALEKFLSRNTLRGDVVSISVPGQSGLARFVKLPPVEEKKIHDIVRFEAKQQIPFNLDEVVWDYQKIGAGEVSEGFAMDTEIGLFAMKRDMINRYLQHFKDVGVEVHVVQMAPLSLCNFVSYDLLGKGAAGDGEDDAGKKKCVVALDIGADSSNLVITDAHRIIWQRPIPLGGNHFTRALTKDLKLTFAKAEHLKRNATKSPDLKKILTALKPVLNDFVGEVQRSLGYFTNTHRDAQVEYLVGLGNAFRLPGLQRYLGDKLQLEVHKLAKMERVAGDAVVTQPAFTENILSFAVAYGLALQGLKRARLLTNLLPGEIRTERLVRAKKPWAIAAAALLLLGSTAWAFKNYREERTYTHPDVANAIKDAKKATDDVALWDRKFNDAKAEAKKEEDAVKAIVAGGPETKNWLELVKFVGDVLPQPDGRNLSDEARQRYMAAAPDKQHHPNPDSAMTGQQAFEAWKNRLTRGDTGGAREDLGPYIDDLVQVNLHSVDCRFTDDLKSFWEKIPAERRNVGDVRPPAQASVAPEGKGWVVELQGYTFHQKRSNFVHDTLLDNIARLGMPDFGKAAAPATPAAPLPPGQPAPPTAELPDRGPVLNRISHVVLYKVTLPTKTASDVSSPFEIIGRSDLAELTKATPAPLATGTVPPATPPGVRPDSAAPAAPALRETWTPLGTMGSAQVSGGPRTGGEYRPTPPPPPIDKVGDPKTSPKSPVATHYRTEFVILFVWKEPTPSAALRKEEGDAPGTPTTPGLPVPPVAPPR